ELDQGRPSDAEPWLRKAVAALPFDRRVSYTLSRCLLELDRRDEAEAVSARVAQLDADVRRLDELRQEILKRPDEARLRCEGGARVRARVAKLDAAFRRLADLRQGILNGPAEAGWGWGGGLLFLRNGERREGIRWLQTALRLDPHCEEARSALANADSAD